MPDSIGYPGSNSLNTGSQVPLSRKASDGHGKPRMTHVNKKSPTEIIDRLLPRAIFYIAVPPRFILHDSYDGLARWGLLSDDFFPKPA